MRKSSLKILLGFHVLVVAAALMLVGCSPKEAVGPAEDPVELKMAHFMSPQHVQHVHVMEPFAEEVQKATDGRVIITIFPGGALGAPTDQLDGIMTGVIDIGYSLHGYTTGTFPLTSVTELPFLARSGVHGTEILNKLYEKFSEIQDEHAVMKPLWIWTHDVGQLVTTNKQVKTLEDLRGMTLRSPSASLNSMIEALGATPVNMPVSEVYESLQRGVVDGAIIPLSTLKDFNLFEVVSYVTLGDFYVLPFYMGMNNDAWNRLSAEDQQILEGLVGERMAIKAAEAYDAGTLEGIRIVEEKGLEQYALPADEMARWRNAIDPLVDEWIKSMEDRGLPGSEVYEEAKRLAGN